MTKFTDLTHEQRMLVHQATTEVYSRITSISTGAMAPLDAMADFFMTAYQMGQQTPRPVDMVVAHHACRYCGGMHDPRVACPEYVTARAPGLNPLYSEYDKKLQNDIAHLQNEHLPYCKHCKQRHAYSDPCELLQALRQATAYAQEEARRALDTTQPLVIDEPERDDPHESLGYHNPKKD